jgi:hypothetical protein
VERSGEGAKVMRQRLVLGSHLPPGTAPRQSLTAHTARVPRTTTAPAPA